MLLRSPETPQGFCPEASDSALPDNQGPLNSLP